MHLPKAIKARGIPDSLLEEKTNQQCNGEARQEPSVRTGDGEPCTSEGSKNRIHTPHLSEIPGGAAVALGQDGDTGGTAEALPDPFPAVSQPPTPYMCRNPSAWGKSNLLKVTHQSEQELELRSPEPNPVFCWSGQRQCPHLSRTGTILLCSVAITGFWDPDWVLEH